MTADNRYEKRTEINNPVYNPVFHVHAHEILGDISSMGVKIDPGSCDSINTRLVGVFSMMGFIFKCQGSHRRTGTGRQSVLLPVLPLVLLFLPLLSFD